VNTVDAPITVDTLWGTNGAYEGTHSLAGGMATSGSITAWLRELVGSVPYPQLLDEARAAGPGAGGLLMLPYFAGERTPIADPGARGVIIGLTTSTTSGQLYRAALEAIALGIRHNVDTFLAAGAQIDHIIAVGGGTQGDLWTQVVSDVTGLSQVVPTITIGASYGAAYLAAKLLADVYIADWNPPASTTTPDPALRAGYDELYAQYRAAYPATRAIVSGLAGIHFP
jgi:xylulokinase